MTGKAIKATKASGGSIARGRPTLYRVEHCARVIALGKKGKSLVQMAVALRVVSDTLHEWARAHPDFSVALTRAREEAQAYWEELGEQGIMGMRPGFSAQAWGRAMAARFPKDWRENARVELTGQDGGPMQSVSAAVSLTPERFEEIARRLMAEV